MRWKNHLNLCHAFWTSCWTWPSSQRCRTWPKKVTAAMHVGHSIPGFLVHLCFTPWFGQNLGGENFVLTTMSKNVPAANRRLVYQKNFAMLGSRHVFLLFSSRQLAAGSFFMLISSHKMMKWLNFTLVSPENNQHFFRCGHHLLSLICIHIINIFSTICRKHFLKI